MHAESRLTALAERDGMNAWPPLRMRALVKEERKMRDHAAQFEAKSVNLRLHGRVRVFCCGPRPGLWLTGCSLYH